MIELGRDLCSDLSVSSRREWLVTNGIGGYASGTISGVPTRRYHGLLVAALNPPLGLRSLSPGDSRYAGKYGGDTVCRDGAYHQGTVWPSLIGPFVTAHLRVYRDPATARSFLLPLLRHLDDHGTGSICEIADGYPPFTPRGCIAQAWSMAEVLRALFATKPA